MICTPQYDMFIASHQLIRVVLKFQYAIDTIFVKPAISTIVALIILNPFRPKNATLVIQLAMQYCPPLGSASTQIFKTAVITNSERHPQY